MSNSVYYEKLIQTVIDRSDASTWEAAVKEWAYEGVEEDEDKLTSCVCGHPELRYLFTIRNKLNGNTLYPIGSVCIKKFNRADLNEIVSIKEQLFELFHTLEKGKRIELNSEMFSRKLLRHLYDIGAFQATPYNNYNPHQDYQFLLDMFNQRGAPLTKQRRKIDAIILNSIKPFLRTHLQRVCKRSS